MTIAEKLKEARKQAGLSQEQLAEKLSVSRSAVAKWESGKGIPDVENLKGISKLLNISIDYLLDDENSLESVQMKEAINLDDYEVHGTCRSKEDAVVVTKYPDAKIYPLFRMRKLNRLEWWLDWISPGLINVVDSFNDMSSYYLVERGDKQLFVNVTKDFITATEMTKKVTKYKFEVGPNRYRKATYMISG